MGRMSLDGDWSEPRDISIPESLAPESFGVAGVLEWALDGSESDGNRSLSDGMDSSVSYFFSNSSLISNCVELNVAGPMALPSFPITEKESVCGSFSFSSFWSVIIFLIPKKIFY